jgi:CheY-like chemotaxis protein
VLVVDDRRDVRYVSERFLTSVGATVATAENGELGVALAVEAQLRGEPFDVIVMDMQMPVMDGHQATALLRSSGIAVPIIALTADAMKGDRERCLASGCDDYITKPLNKSEFVRLVAKYCGEIDLNALHHRRQEKIVKWNAQSGSQLL